MKNAVAVVIAVVLAWSSAAWATPSEFAMSDSWKHILLRSAENVSISLDFQEHHDSFFSSQNESTWSAAPFTISVSYPGLSAQNSVRVVLMNFRRLMGPGAARDAEQLETQQLDLEWRGGGVFSTSIFQFFPLHQEGPTGCFDYRQELAIVISGRWLWDPISRTHNFKLDMHEAMGRVLQH